MGDGRSKFVLATFELEQFRLGWGNIVTYGGDVYLSINISGWAFGYTSRVLVVNLMEGLEKQAMGFYGFMS